MTWKQRKYYESDRARRKREAFLATAQQRGPAEIEAPKEPQPVQRWGSYRYDADGWWRLVPKEEGA